MPEKAVRLVRVERKQVIESRFVVRVERGDDAIDAGGDVVALNAPAPVSSFATSALCCSVRRLPLARIRGSALESAPTSAEAEMCRYHASLSFGSSRSMLA